MRKHNSNHRLFWTKIVVSQSDFGDTERILELLRRYRAHHLIAVERVGTDWRFVYDRRRNVPRERLFEPNQRGRKR